MEELNEKVALVTGASRGIGRQNALSLGRAGCHVAVNYHERREKAEPTRSALAGSGRRTIAVKADVSRSGDVKRMMTMVEHSLGSIDMLVNNAGLSTEGKSKTSPRRTGTKPWLGT